MCSIVVREGESIALLTVIEGLRFRSYFRVLKANFVQISHVCHSHGDRAS